MNRKYITVLDFELGEVIYYVFDTDENTDYEEIQELLSMKHSLTNCEWMIHSSNPFKNSLENIITN